MRRTNRHSLSSIMATALWLACAGMVGAEPRLALEPKQKVVEGIGQVSPPSLQLDEAGMLRMAWFEKQGDTRGVYLATIPDGTRPGVTKIQVNGKGTEPDAMHQSPGLAVGTTGDLYATWSTPNKEVPFAANLLLARSTDGGATFLPPVVVNDDGSPISHSFEFVQTGPNDDVYLAWLDNRNKDKSGAGAMFACSRDGGVTVQKNLAVDGMACPCCRPMMAASPDGSLWMAWRKTFEGNVRDVVVARSTDGGRTFTAPTIVQRDGWSFPACPHRGPSIAFDRQGRLYVGWYTEGTDEQPRIFIATSDDQGKTFSSTPSLHLSTTSLPDQFRFAVHPDGHVVAVWEEVTGVRKRVVMRMSWDRGATFGPVQPLSDGAKAENPTVVIHRSGAVAIGWTEHAWPNNSIVVQRARLPIGQHDPQADTR